MKRVLIILLALFLSISFAACGGAGGTDDAAGDDTGEVAESDSANESEIDTHGQWPEDSGLYKYDTNAGTLGEDDPVSGPDEADSLFGISASHVYSYQSSMYYPYYDVTFIILDKDGNRIIVPAKMDVKVIDNDGTEVYAGSFNITKDNYSYDEALGYTGHVWLPRDEFKQTTRSSGAVVAHIYNEGHFDFEDYDMLVGELPAIPADLVLPECPFELTQDFSGALATIRVDNITGSYAIDTSGTVYYLRIKGEIVDVSSKYAVDQDDVSIGTFDFKYTATDEDGNMVEDPYGMNRSSISFTPRGKIGDAFTEDFSIKDLEFGKKYFLTLFAAFPAEEQLSRG